MKKTLQWMANVEAHYAQLWVKMGVPTNPKHGYIVDDKHSQKLLHPSVQPFVPADMAFHSPNNPKSSQLLALNLFRLAEQCGSEPFRELFSNPSLGQPEVTFEWVDPLNVLRQGGKPSNHDVLLDFGAHKYLVEMKFAEHTDAACGSSMKNDECKKNLASLRCPLEEAYDTQYYRMLRVPCCPYDPQKLGAKYPNDCPFLHGEQYQIMRYILFCHAKTTLREQWHPVIVYPRGNSFMDNEITITRSVLRDPDELTRIYLEDFIAALSKYNAAYGAWLSDRYIV